MSDSGEDWDAEISSGTSKPVQWTGQTSNVTSPNSNAYSQNSPFSAPEKRYGRGRGRARGSPDNWRATNGSNNTSWRDAKDGRESFDNGWSRKPRGGFNDSGSTQSGGFGSRYPEDGISGDRQDGRGVMRIEVSSRDVGKIIGEFGWP